VKIYNEVDLIELAKNDIAKSSADVQQKTIKFFAGCLPMLYHAKDDSVEVELGEFKWGLFSSYTFELACVLLKYKFK